MRAPPEPSNDTTMNWGGRAGRGFGVMGLCAAGFRLVARTVCDELWPYTSDPVRTATTAIANNQRTRRLCVWVLQVRFNLRASAASVFRGTRLAAVCGQVLVK